MKATPQRVSELTANIGKYTKREVSTEPSVLSEMGGIFDELLQSSQWDGEKLLELSGAASSFDSHLHVGAFRKVPKKSISKRSLPVTAATTPWHNLLDNGLDLEGSDKPQNVVNRALDKLDISYQVATRLRKMVAYMPTNTQGEGAVLDEDFGFTETELVFQDKAGLAHSIQSLGSGIGVIVPVVVALSATDTELLSIEEPESHVHPRLQAELGDIVITAALGRQKRTLFIETHSEHLILRILRRIRETTEGKMDGSQENLHLRPDDISVLYVKNGKVTELPVTPDGDFSKSWPDGFFDERFEEYE